MSVCVHERKIELWPSSNFLLLSSSGWNNTSFENVKFYSSSSFSSGSVHLSSLICFQKLRRGVASNSGSILMPLQLLHFFIWSLQACHGMTQYVLIDDWTLRAHCQEVTFFFEYPVANIRWTVLFAFDQTRTTEERILTMTFLGG